MDCGIKSQCIRPDGISGMVVGDLPLRLPYHILGVGLSGSVQARPLDVLVCADSAELKGVGETAAVRGNRATHLKLCNGSIGQLIYTEYICDVD